MGARLAAKRSRIHYRAIEDSADVDVRLRPNLRAPATLAGLDQHAHRAQTTAARGDLDGAIEQLRNAAVHTPRWWFASRTLRPAEPDLLVTK